MKTNNKTQKIIFSLIFLAILAGVTYYIYRDLNNSQKDITQDTPQEQVSLEEQIKSAIEAEGDFDVEVIPVENTQKVSAPAPALDRKVVFKGDLPKEAQDITLEKINKLTDQLKKDNMLFEQWIDLGLQYKLAGDYQGAREAWEYAGLISPSNSISFHNLGDLYGYYLHDNQKAEENFLIAIKNSPNNSMYYFKLTEFYRDVEGDASKAKELIQDAVNKNPSSEELKQLLESL